MSSTRESGAHALSGPLRSLLSRDSLIVGAALAAAAILAWLWLLNSSSSDMSDMGGMAMAAEPMSAAYLVPAFAMWAVMMVAMMLPSAAPMVLLHARIARAPSSAARAAHSLLFASAYLLVWTGFSAAAAMAQAMLVASGAISAASLSIGSRALAAALLIAAAAYELTAAKRACLYKCQAPLLFMARNYRPGAAGALRAGLLHGLYCLGCCWALMLLLFVGGAMNLAWVAVLGIAIVGQKLAPASWHGERAAAVALMAGAAALLAW